MGNVDRKQDKYYNVSNLQGLFRALRSKEGCPWDRAQTHESLKKNLIEETYELVDALETGNDEDVKEELGDLLLQVLFHSTIAEEEGRFTLQEVMQGLGEKIVRRHPHVFKKEGTSTKDEAEASWNEQKQKEKNNETTTESMKRIPKQLPALMKADKIQRKAKKVGFDWDHHEEVVKKVEEELQEFLEAIKEKNQAHMEEEAGDLLFSVVNLVRFFDIEPEEALNKTSSKFIERFEQVEEMANEGGTSMKNRTLSELDQLWEKAKTKKIKKT